MPKKKIFIGMSQKAKTSKYYTKIIQYKITDL